VVEELSEHFEVVLLTRGDEGVQRRRIAESGLEGKLDRIWVVASKGRATFERILVETRHSAKESWSVGNSLPSDIYPALEAGMSAVWVDAHVWEYERRLVEKVEGRLFKADRLTEVPRLLTGLNESRD
jgi:putative hydrolase of the HAD superfamily